MHIPILKWFSSSIVEMPRTLDGIIKFIVLILDSYLMSIQYLQIAHLYIVILLLSPNNSDFMKRVASVAGVLTIIT